MERWWKGDHFYPKIPFDPLSKRKPYVAGIPN